MEGQRLILIAYLFAFLLARTQKHINVNFYNELIKMHKNLADKIINLIQNNSGMTIKELASQLKVNRTFLSGYLEALEDKGYVKFKKIGPAKVYFKENVKR